MIVTEISSAEIHTNHSSGALLTIPPLLWERARPAALGRGFSLRCAQGRAGPCCCPCPCPCPCPFLVLEELVFSRTAALGSVVASCRVPVALSTRGAGSPPANGAAPCSAQLEKHHSYLAQLHFPKGIPSPGWPSV